MPQHEPAWYVGFGIGLVIGSLVTGALVGLVPLLLGRKLAQPKLGVAGFAVCVLGSLVGGLLLSVPAAAVFSVTAWWRRRAQQRFSDAIRANDGALYLPNNRPDASSK